MWVRHIASLSNANTEDLSPPDAGLNTVSHGPLASSVILTVIEHGHSRLGMLLLDVIAVIPQPLT